MHFCHQRLAPRLIFAGTGIAVLFVVFTFLVFKPHLVRHNEQAFLRDPFAGHPRTSPHHTGNPVPTKVSFLTGHAAVVFFAELGVLSVAHVPYGGGSGGNVEVHIRRHWRRAREGRGLGIGMVRS